MGLYQPSRTNEGFFRSQFAAIWAELHRLSKQATKWGAGGETDWSTAEISVAAGFDTGSGDGLKRFGPCVELRYTVLRDGATLTASSSGSVEQTILTITNANLRPKSTTVCGVIESGTNGDIGGTIKVTSAGAVILSTLYPSQGIIDNSLLRFSARWMVG